MKIGCLLALLALTLGCGLVPICFKWFQMDAATGTVTPTKARLRPFPTPGLGSHAPPPNSPGAVCGSPHSFPRLVADWRVTSASLPGHHYRVLSLLGCVSAGVFLGAGLMHMTAEALGGIESEIQKFMVQVGSRDTE